MKKIAFINRSKREYVIFKTVLLLNCFVYGIFPCLASSAQWETQPIFTGEMISIVVDPYDSDIVYVGTRDAGVYKTIDGGISWKPARNGLTYFPIRTLIADPQNNGTLYAGTDYDGIYKTTDAGASWTKQSDDIDSTFIVYALVMDPADTSTLFAGLAGGVALVIGNVFKSTDGGATWTCMDNGIPRYRENSSYTNGILSLALDPTNSSIVYAGTQYDGVFMSSDGGANWTAINNGVPETGEYLQSIDALAVNPHDHGLYAIIEGLGNGYHLFDTDDESWCKISTTTYPCSGSHIHYDPTDASIVHVSGGLSGQHIMSMDGGVTWNTKLAHPDSGTISEISYHASQPATIYAASDVGLSIHVGGVYKSLDSGDTWTLVNDGITAANVNCVAVAPTTSCVVFTGSDTGAIFHTTDGGETWQSNFHDFNSTIDDIKIDPSDSSRIYVASAGLHLSTDQGETFTEICSMRNAQVIAVNPITSMVFVGCGLGEGIFKSSDDSNWTQVTTGFPVFGGSTCPIESLVVDPATPSTLWAGTLYGGGILKSVDNGDSWVSMGLTEYNEISAIAVSPGNSDTIIAGIGYPPDCILKSEDGGQTWVEKLSILSPVTGVVFDPENNEIVYASTEGMGVFVSYDEGESWEDFNEGIFYPLLSDLAVSNGGPFSVWGSTFGSGLYKYLLSQPKVSLASVTVTGSFESNDPVTVTVSGSTGSEETLYYKFYYCADYGTEAYDTSPWIVMQDYSTANTCRYTFPQDGSYIVVVRVVADPGDEPASLPIIGGSVSIGNSENPRITQLSSSVLETVPPNTPVTYTVSAADSGGNDVYYKWFYRSGYGTPDYDSLPWVTVQDYSLSTNCEFTFPEDGDYIVVVRAVTNPNNEPVDLPIIGSIVTCSQ